MAIVVFNTYNSTKAYSTTISSVNINGTNRISNDFILNKAGIDITYDKIKKEGFKKNISNSELNDIVKKIYESGNFSDVSAVIEKNNLLIDVVETPVIGDVYFVGSDLLDNDDVKKVMSTRSRQPYSKNKIKLDLDRFYATFQKMGYLDVYIEPRVVFLNDNSVDVIFNFSEGDVSYIKDIYFYGNENFSSRKLKEQLSSRERGLFSLMPNSGGFEEEKFEADKKILKNFYQDNGYVNAEIVSANATFDKKNYQFKLHFNINEGEKFSFGEYEIEDYFNIFKNDSEFKKNIDIKEGEMFKISKVREVIYNISEYLSKNGYANVKPDFELDIDDDEKKVNVNFKLNFLQKMFIDRIEITGNERTKDKVILRELLIKEGDIYDKNKIEESKDRIYMLGFFKDVQIKETIIPNSDLVKLDVVVEEQFSGKINASIGWNSYYGIVGSVSITLDNFLGRGFTIGVGVERNGYMESYSAMFYDPYFFRNQNVGFGINARYSRFGDLGGGTKYVSYMLYKGYSYSFSTSLSFELLNRLTLQTSIGFSRYVYRSLNSSGYLLYDQLLGNRVAYTLGLTLTYNKLNRYRFATNGYIVQYGMTFGGFGFLGGQQFMQNILNVANNLQIFGEDLILHTEASGGISTAFRNEQIGMEHLFSLGGYQKMRGFNFFGIGPRIVAIEKGIRTSMYYATDSTQYYYLSAELRSPVFIPKDYGIYFSLFVDAGSAWGFAGDVKTIGNKNHYEYIYDTSKIRMSAGIGITWNSPIIGEIGFYYAKPIIKREFDTTLEFGIKMGHSFG